MKLSAQDLKDLAQLACSAAKKASQMIQERIGTDFVIEKKEGAHSLASSVLTEVDLASQKILLEELLPSCKKYDLGLLSEEQTDDKSRLEKDYFWAIDPIDGTLPFTEARPGFSVCIALVSQSGESQLGIIADPYNKDLYLAIRGQGLWQNGLAWSPELKKERNTLKLFMDRSFSSFAESDGMEKFRHEIKTHGYETVNIHYGAAAMNAMWVLANAPAAYFKFSQKRQGGGSIWDFAASACFYAEASAHCSSFHGNELALNQTHTSFMNEQGVVFATNSELALAIRKSKLIR